MSHIGRRLIQVPDGVTLTISDKTVTAKGPEGELVLNILPQASVVAADGGYRIEVKGTKRAGAIQGLTLRLVENLIEGVHEGYTRDLELKGVGYRATMQGNDLVLNVGYSHPVTIQPPQGVNLAVQKSTISVSGIDKQLVGQVAANIRRVRPPEPYKGKGIRYVGELVRKKAGKAAKAAGSA